MNGDADEDPAAVACARGFVSVLLAEPLADSREALAALLEPIAAELGPIEPGLLVGPGPFPSDRVDRRFWPAGQSLGAAFLSILADPPGQDGWQPGGGIRQRLRLACALVRAHGVGVVAHRAGQVALPAGEWLRRVGDPDDPDLRGFASLVDVGRDPGGVLYTQGMGSFGLPDVAVDTGRLGLPDDEAFERAQTAALLACHRMVWSGRILPGELAVPCGVEVGARPLERDNPGLSELVADRFRVLERGARIELEPVAPLVPLARHWAEHRSDLPFPAYRALLMSSLRARDWQRIARLSFAAAQLAPGLPEHDVAVMARPGGDFAILSCGIGRRAQPGGSIETDNAHVEFVVTLPEHHPAIAELVSMVGRLWHGRGPEAPPWAPEHRVMMDGGPLAAAGFPFLVFGWAGALELGEGPPICLYAPVPMTAREREEVPIDEVGEWIQSTGAPSLAERWARLIE